MEFEMVLTKKHEVVLKRFIRLLKVRLHRIKWLVDDGYVCGKFVLRDCFGRPIRQRCFGSIGKYGCYNCNPTDFSCPECGDNVGREGEFCGGYCRWVYYGKGKY